MYSEKDILYKMKSLASDFMIMIYQCKLDLIQLNDDIKNLNNSYFEEHSELLIRLNAIFSQKELTDLSFLLQDFKAYTDFKIDTLCEHEWINDEIDISPDKIRNITYCKLCEITRR